MIAPQEDAPLFKSKYICHPAYFGVMDLNLNAWPVLQRVIRDNWLVIRRVGEDEVRKEFA